MRPFQSRRVILVFVACAVAAGNLLVAGSTLAETALFRVEQRWHNSPNPPVTTPGGAGMDQAFIQPYTARTAMGEYIYPPATAIVEPGNPVGGAFTLPTGFINVTGTYTTTPKTGRLGFTTVHYVDYYNGPGRFGPNHGATGPTRIVFPTTMGNPYPNFGTGRPVTPTTTFSGRYDFTRAGSINVTPGPRRFGGTLRLFYGPNAGFYQNIYYYTPANYKVYRHHICLDEGKIGCTPSTFVSDIGDTTAIYRTTRFLLNVKGTGTGGGNQSNTAKATTPTTPYGNARTPYGNASFITAMQQYLNRIHPWTTGFASVRNPIGSPNIITPQAQGYDTSLGGADITVTHHDWNQVWNKTLSTLTTSTATTKQYLYGVGRVVSMVRPRLIHGYRVPLDPVPVAWDTTQAARMQVLKVFFLPEPAGLLMLGVGVVGLLGLSRMRRR
jgi:hypothetical protein